MSKIDAETQSLIERAKAEAIERKASLEAYAEMVETHPTVLFGLVPALPGGESATISPDIERRCSMAVAAVLRGVIAELDKSLKVLSRPPAAGEGAEKQ